MRIYDKMELINQIDQTFSFNKNTIRIVGTYDKPWFVAKDVCELLDLKDNRSALRILPNEWKGEQVLPTLGGNQNMAIINECGLYKIIMRTNKPNAEKFQEFVCEEILPSIRKSGEYKYQKILDEKNKLEEENKRIEEENKFLTDAHIEKNKEIKNLQNKVIQKQRKRKYEDRNCVYLVQDEHHKKERIYIVGKAIDLNDRLSSYNKTHDTEIIYYRSCNSAKQMNHIEKCVLTKLDKYREVANHDRFILPENEDISLFTNVFDLFVNAFNDVDESVDIEKDLTQDEIKQRLMDMRREYIEDNRETINENKRVYNEENAEQIALVHKKYVENNKEKSDAYQAEYRENNKDALTAYSKKYYEENKDKHNDISAKYREEHKDEINENSRKYYDEHTEKFKEYKKEYYEQNKESVLERAKEYYIENKEVIIEKTKERYVENKVKIRAYQSEKILCECGIKLQRNFMSKHKKTEIHRLSLENKLSGNPSPKVLKITCSCGHKVRSNYMKRHLLSKIHESGVKIQQKKIHDKEVDNEEEEKVVDNKEEKNEEEEEEEKEVNNKEEEEKEVKNNPIIICACGIKLKLSSSKRKTHLNSKAHVKFIENQHNI
jgi:prophage antirepressor-like protein